MLKLEGFEVVVALTVCFQVVEEGLHLVFILKSPPSGQVVVLE